MSDIIVERIRAYAESLLPSLGLELFDIQFRREGHGWVLRLLIDREGGVSLDDCARVSREAGDFLDVEDLIGHPYHLEVSSPGAERPLRTLDECRRHVGAGARFTLHEPVDGDRVVSGEITRVDDRCAYLKNEAGDTYTLAWSNVKRARLAL